jgi:hypothetical protein
LLAFFSALQQAAKGKKGKGGDGVPAAVSLDAGDRAEYNKLKATGEGRHCN